MALGAGDALRAGKLAPDGEKHLVLPLAERGVCLEQRHVLAQLVHVRHARQHHVHAIDAAHERECPFYGACVRAQLAQRCHVLVVERYKNAAAQRLHHPDAQAAVAQPFHLLARFLELPVHVVQLDLAEFHDVAVGAEEPFEGLEIAMHREAQVLDATGAHLLYEERHGAEAVVIEVLLDVELAHVVHQVVIEVLHATAFQLLGEDDLVLSEIGRIVTRELGRQAIRIAIVAGKGAAHHALRIAPVVAPCGVEVVDAMLHGVVDHLEHSGFVDLVVIAVDDRQAHGAEPERGQLFILEIGIQHGDSSLSTT